MFREILWSRVAHSTVCRVSRQSQRRAQAFRVDQIGRPNPCQSGARTQRSRSPPKWELTVKLSALAVVTCQVSAPEREPNKWVWSSRVRPRVTPGSNGEATGRLAISKGRDTEMKQNIGVFAAAVGLLIVMFAPEPALAQKAGGILKMYSPDSP